MSVNKTDITMLLAHMLKTPAVLEAASTQLVASYFTDPGIGGAPFHAFLFDIISQYFKKYRVAPDLASMTSDLVRIMNHFGLKPGDVAFSETDLLYREFKALLPDVSHNSVPQARGAIAEITRICIHDVEAKAAVASADASGNFSDLAARLAKISMDHRQHLDSHGQCGLYTGEDMGPEQRVRFGIDFLDKRLGEGKGPTTGCAGTLIAAQGGGKSSFSYQVCVSQILMGNPALLVITETGWDRTIKAKVLSCLTGIPWSIISEHGCQVERAIKDPRCTEHDPATVQTKLDLFNKFFYVHDVVANPGGLETIKLTIDNISNRYGRPPTVVVIDWAGPLADYMLATHNERQVERKESALRKISEGCADIGRACNTFCWVTHQMSNLQVEKGPAADATEYCGVECRNFTQAMKLVVTVNKKCPKTNIQKVCLAKCRDATSGGQILVKLDGQVSTFKEASGWKQAGRRFVEERNVRSSSDVPVESARRNATTME